MIELNPLISISKEIRAWAESLRKVSNEENARLKKAVESLSKAVLSTKTYVHNKPKKRDLELEAQLRDLWNKAHIDLKEFDYNLAMRCFAKAEYWTNPVDWSAQKVRDYNITLDSMSDALKGI